MSKTKAASPAPVVEDTGPAPHKYADLIGSLPGEPAALAWFFEQVLASEAWGDDSSFAVPADLLVALLDRALKAPK